MGDRAAERGRITTIAVVGDVHDQWDQDDELALKRLGVDLVLLVGDFGNESVPVVQAIAALPMPKAAIFGNHDAWYTATDWGRKKCPYDRQVEDRVQQQIDLLGAAHVGYGKLDLPELGLSVVGGRPFSWGGSSWKYGEFYSDRYNITSMEDSTERILESVRATTHNTLLFIGHNGPKGLGDRPEDPCGRDWQPLGGDYGDPDLAGAIAQARTLGKTVPLVAFGHMHHNLRHTHDYSRRTLHIDDHGTIYVNAARVPRIIETDDDRLHNFTLVLLKQGAVFQVSMVWANGTCGVQSRQIFYQAPLPEPQEERDRPEEELTGRYC